MDVRLGIAGDLQNLWRWDIEQLSKSLIWCGVKLEDRCFPRGVPGGMCDGFQINPVKTRLRLDDLWDDISAASLSWSWLWDVWTHQHHWTRTVWDHSGVFGICSTSWWDELTHTHTKHWFTHYQHTHTKHWFTHYEHTHTHTHTKHWFTHYQHTHTHTYDFWFQFRCFVGITIFKHSYCQALQRCYTLSLSLSHTNTHLSFSLTHTNTHTHSFSHTHTLTHSLFLTHTFSHTNTHTLYLSLSHTHTQTLTHTLSPHTHTLPLSHSHSLSLSHSHTHTHTHTFTASLHW